MSPNTEVNLKITLSMVALLRTILRKTAGFPHEATDPILRLIDEQVGAQIRPAIVPAPEPATEARDVAA